MSEVSTKVQTLNFPSNPVETKEGIGNNCPESVNGNKIDETEISCGQSTLVFKENLKL